jgi:hypothetical protein
LEKQFQRRRFLEINQSKTRIACGSHLIKQIVVFCAIYNLFLLRLRYTSRPGGTGIIKMAVYEFPD